MKTKSTAKLPSLTTLHHKSPTRVLAGRPPGRNPVLALLLGFLWAALLMLPAAKASASSVITYLYSFTGDVDGEDPEAGLVQGTDGFFYGTSAGGGAPGSVFKISAAGAFTLLYPFGGGSDGADPLAGLVQGSDGYFYGTTYGAGTNNYGTVFKIGAAGALTKLYSFAGGTDGSFPQAGLVQGADGSFYGTTSGGGTNNAGTVFKISATGALTKLYSFTGGTDGEAPKAGLLLGTDGYFYGTTYFGGTNGSGTVFKISATGALTKLYSFTGGSDGANPQAGLVQGADGNFYGTTYHGGNTTAPPYTGYGAVFKISATGAFTSLYSFTGGSDGSYPVAGLAQGADGNFYGTTSGAGLLAGSVFKISATGALTSLYSFTNNNDGLNPDAGLVLGSDGNFYGTTAGGGTNGSGTVFRLNISSASPVYSFTNLSFTGGNDGKNPVAGLVQGSDGYFYGTTQLGGASNYGAVFKVTGPGALTPLYSFTNGSDGAVPFAGLVQGTDGYFYGTTQVGGTNGDGAVFKISANGAFTSLYSFTGGNDGGFPWAGLAQGTDGYFYGTTSQGGTNGVGTVFKISATGAFTSLYSFTNGNDGSTPDAGLVQGTDGDFYGTTYFGGTNDSGTVFKISAAGALTSLYSFTGGGDGKRPYSALVQGSDGDFYGTTSSGTQNGGTVFKISAAGSLTPLHVFLESDGEEPYAGLVQGSDGYFYGTTYGGGTNSLGTVFKISATGTFTSLYSFAGLDGAHPQGVLVQGTDGYFYGTTDEGGTNFGVTIGDGTVFRMNFSAAPVQGLFTLGDSLSSRTFNSDGDPTNAQFVVDFPITSPGNLQSILTWGQNSGTGIPGVGQTFYAYVLRPVGTNFQVMLETGALTVTNTGTNLFAAPPFALQVGDLIAHYGRGIPFSNGTGGPSSTYDNNGQPLPMPSVGQLLQLPGTTYPLYNDGGRNYAIAVVVSGVPNLAITPSGNNLILSWPANGASTLLQTTNLASGPWTTNSTFTSISGTNIVTVSPSAASLFFRLRNP